MLTHIRLYQVMSGSEEKWSCIQYEYYKLEYSLWAEHHKQSLQWGTQAVLGQGRLTPEIKSL